MDKTLGSLFDGIGGFPLASSYSGFQALWASEIEPFPILVTKTRFPQMRHLGDITKINGADIEPVSVIAGGSPCQDLSVAGKRAGLAGQRSGLFMEQIKRVKEMREADAKRGRAGKFIRPRFMVWENVPGAFSSNGVEDFRAVLEETCRVVDNTVSIPRPPDGWPTVGAIMGNGFSIAWRVLDAQYWGVPQRRRRIFLVADFGGESAPEILFKPESMSGDFTSCGAPGKRTAANAEGSTGTASEDCLTPWDVQSRRIYPHSGKWPSLYAGEGGGHGYAAIPINDQATHEKGGCNGSMIGAENDPMYSLTATDRHAVAVSAGFKGKAGAKAGNIGFEKELSPTIQAGQQTHVVCYDARGNGDGTTACTMTGDHNGNIGDYTALAVIPCYSIDKAAYNSGENSSYGFQVDENLSPTLTSRQPPDACYQKVTGTLSPGAHPGGYNGQDASNDMLVAYSRKFRYYVRRLTPLECERLQGYPDGWTDIPGASDSARYKALGNSVAVPCVARTYSEELRRN